MARRLPGIFVGLVLVAMVVVALLISLAPDEGRSYEVTEVVIDAEVRPDGSLHVTEARTVDFRGQYSWMEQWIPHGTEVSVIDVAIGEPGQPYERTGLPKPGEYGVTEDTIGTTIRWHYAADHEQKTFILSYTVTDAVLVHNDVAELYWKFIGNEWEVPTGEATVSLRLPAGAGDIRAWGHGPLQGEVTIDDGEGVTWSVTELPPWTMVEGRVVFALDSVPEATRFTGQTALPAILAEETVWANEANRMRQWIRFDLIAAIAGIPLGLVLLIWLWRQFGRDPRPDWSGPYYRELPGNYSPAELTTLLSRHLQHRLGPGLAATLLDLNRRGHVQLEPITAAGVRRSRDDLRVRRSEPADSDPLRGHEKQLLNLLFNDVAVGGDEMTLSALNKWFKQNPEKSLKFVNRWQKALERRQKALGFWTPEPEVAARLSSIKVVVLIGAALLAGFLAWKTYSLHFSLYVFWPLLALAAIIVLFAARRSQDGANQLARWRAFRRFLLHFSRLDLAEVPAVALWEHYLVYATALGVAEQVLKQMKQVLPRLPQEQLETHGRMYSSLWLHADRFATIDTLQRVTARAERTFAAAASSAISRSSGGGGGGGFSVGGGGGGGGGGGRAG